MRVRLHLVLSGLASVAALGAVFALGAFAHEAHAGGGVAKDVQCTAGGHGPYDETWASCLRQGADQARSSCAMTSADAEVEVVAERREAGGRVERRRTRCTARFDAASQECASRCAPYAREKSPFKR